MNYLIETSSLIILGFLAYQDFKQREISWILIPLLIILHAIISIRSISLENAVLYFLINSGFILLQLLFLTVYFSVKNRAFTNIINTYLGIGDIWFFVVLALAFSPVNFILFYLGSLFLTMIGFLVWKGLSKSSEKEIPLAGVMAVGLMGCFVYKWVSGFDMYRDVAL